MYVLVHIVPHIILLRFTHISFILFIKITYGVLLRQNSQYHFWDVLCLMNNGNIIVGYLIKENWWSYTWLLFLLKINGCLFVRLSWIKINMTDIIIDDEWIKTWMLEYVCLVSSSIDMNIEASYQPWKMAKWELLNEVIQ